MCESSAWEGASGGLLIGMTTVVVPCHRWD